jgi:sorbitol-specific phosphotransferase system component IIC
VVNGSIHYAAVIVRLHPFRPGESVQHHWGIACGCANAELDWTSLAAWYTAEGILP